MILYQLLRIRNSKRKRGVISRRRIMQDVRDAVQNPKGMKIARDNKSGKTHFHQQKKNKRGQERQKDILFDIKVFKTIHIK